MKNFIKRSILSIAVMFICLIATPDNVSALTPSDLIVPQQTENEEEIIALHDTSWSMRTTFKWEDKIIREKTHNNFVFNKSLDFSSGEKSNIWETINMFSEDYDNILLVSDLWDTCSVNLETADGKTLVIMVPYYSSYNEGVKHVEDVVMNTILKTWTNSTVYVIYMNDEISTFSNSVEDVSETLPEEPVSDEEASENIATSITEEVAIDEEIPRDSIIVCDFSGSMSEFVQLLFEQLTQMTTTKQIETLYAFETYVSEAISPENISENLWYDLSLGGTSNIIGGVRKAAQASPSAHIYLITDLLNNEGYWKLDEAFTGLISVIEYRSNTIDDYDIQYANKVFDSLKSNYPNAESITRVRAN